MRQALYAQDQSCLYVQRSVLALCSEDHMWYQRSNRPVTFKDLTPCGISAALFLLVLMLVQ